MNDEWYRRNNIQFVSLNQNGPVMGHYLKIDGTSVVTYATSKDPKSKYIFKFGHMFKALLSKGSRYMTKKTKIQCESNAAVFGWGKSNDDRY